MNSTWTDLGSSPGFLGERPAINRLRYGSALKILRGIRLCGFGGNFTERNNGANTDLLCPQVCIAGLLLAEKGAVHRVVLLQLHGLHLLLDRIHGGGAAWSCLKSATRKGKTIFRCRLSYEKGRKLIYEARISYCPVTVRQKAVVTALCTPDDGCD